ncbi:MAG: hypothetical protein HOL07_05815 [Rhodospirillaceae bacterium]|jgi:hypothetical protein|nr:hypothetical protein [Rhodospirillaceae bacterium]MBT3809138.1 hypothetical protein [Rhodospirillaceae bacterium]MBT3931437.1 hypothetical protein [Rhodospirillaceae bacterium]MBT4771667.1 hypothetical protein [Rhodospirillaceae bacterium]MBT5357849.1 hypothetical protein [Rhodospirillaceae bacterium]
MTLRHIRLELGRDHDFPEGSVERGYEFAAPLTDDGHLNRDEWHDVRDQCTVRRFWHNEPDEQGHLVHRGSGWAFHYEDEPADEDEPLFKLDRHTLVEGEYVSITEHDGVLRTFRVVQVR